jgi:omega-hydroxy-beta-dihydromenaquinone-9 sulfotransferase
MTAVAKHRWSVTRQFLTGVTADGWWQILRANGGAIEPRYLHRAAYITAMSLINSIYRRREDRRYAAAVAQTELAGPPLFVIGHWRSGTTHLHNLLALDTAQFAYPTVYQASFPHTFLLTEASFPRLVGRFVPPTRELDNVAFGFEMPQEDEFAVCVASGLSSLLGMVFPQQTALYDRYLTMHNLPRDVVERWKATLLWYLKKLTLRYGKTVVLKSPQHTARLRLLLELFPDARFVHIYRDPYAVYQSTVQMYDTMAWHTYLQRPPLEQIEEQILSRYVTMYDAYFADRAAIPAAQITEVRYEDLIADPRGQLQRVYRELGLDGFARCEPALQRYLDGVRGYQPTSRQPLSEPLRMRIAERWARNFAAWEYAS